MKKENLFKALDEGTIDEITDLLYEDFESTVKILKQLKNELTAPTADEVCKALEKDYQSIIEYKNGKFTSHTDNTFYRDIIWIDNRGLVHFNNCEKPHLIEMIGAFYKGEMRNE